MVSLLHSIPLTVMPLLPFSIPHGPLLITYAFPGSNAAGGWGGLGPGGGCLLKLEEEKGQ